MLYPQRSVIQQTRILKFNNWLGLRWVSQKYPDMPASITQAGNVFFWELIAGKDMPLGAFLTHKRLLPKDRRETRNRWRATGRFFNPIRIVGD